MSVASEDIDDRHRSADIFAHLAKDVSFGNVFVEALAVGVLIVGYDLARTL